MCITLDCLKNQGLLFLFTVLIIFRHIWNITVVLRNFKNRGTVILVLQTGGGGMKSGLFYVACIGLEFAANMDIIKYDIHTLSVSNSFNIIPTKYRLPVTNICT